MRVAVFHNLPGGGARRVVQQHCRGLRARGHEVVVYEPETADSTTWDICEVADRVVRVQLEWREPLLTGSRLTRPFRALANLQRLRGNYRRLGDMGRSVAAQIDAADHDVLYVHHDLFETAPSVLVNAQTPSVYFCQEPCRAMFEAPVHEAPGRTPAPLPKALWRQALAPRPFVAFRILNERANTLAADRVLANSAYSIESILRAHGRVAQWCRLGVDTEFFSPGGEQKGEFVLSVGGFDVRKGYRFLVRALGEVPAEQRPELVLVGGPRTPQEVEELDGFAAARGVRIRPVERPSDDELRALYGSARVFVYAPYLEPLGLAPLEAMACGTPVLGVAEGGVRETVIRGATGRLVRRDEREFARVLGEMLSDEAALEELGRRAREHVLREWTWDLSVEHLLSHFEEVLAERAARTA